MGNLQFCKYKFLLYGKDWRRLSSDQNDIWTGVFLICLLYLSKKTDFQVSGGGEPLKCHHEKVHEETRFPPKPHWRDLGFAGEPKIKLLNQNLAQNSRLWCQHKLWIETLQRFFCCPRIQHDTATSSCVNVEDGEILWLREDDELGNAPWLENKKHYIEEKLLLCCVLVSSLEWG